MRITPLGHAKLACVLLLQVIATSADPQNGYYQFPNGQLTPLYPAPALFCGDCPAGTAREPVNGPYCGRCLPVQQSCAAGTYLNAAGQCQNCPCPEASGSRRFGTTCRLDSDGQVTCDCPSGYTGRDCSQCAPGAIQNNVPPYNCMRVNSTNSFAVTCPLGNPCPQPSIPQILQMPQQTQPICPLTQTQSQGQSPTLCPLQNQTSSCPPVSCPPCPTQCPTNRCPQVPPSQCPLVPPNPPPAISPPTQCPGSNRCPTNPSTCPLNPQQPVTCPNVPSPPPPVVPPWAPPPPPPCPGPIQCPGIPPTPQTPCPTNPPTSCPQCPIQNCPNPCPNPCNPSDCPDPCQKCPEIPQCPDCKVSCPACPPCIIPGVDPMILPCVCDPRGTAAQTGSECICKVNAQGARCDQCKKGYFGLSSTRPEGCISCFCSGLTDSCTAATYYRSTLRTDKSLNCTIELTNEDHSVVYSQGSTGFSFDGTSATYNKGANRRLFWSLPSCLKGDRVTSYGGYLSFTRMCTGSGTSLGADHEVMLVGGSGATVFWTTFEPQLCDGNWNHIDVLLAEPAYWSSWKGEQYRRATRADIMEVLADLQLILIRATFSSNTQVTSIKNVTLSSVTKGRTFEGITTQVESCRCPTGYRGLSCESCAPGYYRDTTDMSKSIFGACKPCPCGKTAEGCHLSNGQVVCQCRQGFSGASCQDKEVITITCDPFRIREVEGAEVDFTCSFTTNSKRHLLMRLGKEGSPEKAEETTSLTRSIVLEKGLRRVACEVVDNSGVTWAVVYCAVELIPETIKTVSPPPRVIAVIPTETFICVNETQAVTMACDVHHFGQRKLIIEWRREGSSNLMGTGKDMTIHNAAIDDSGTYICSATDGEVVGAGQVALMVRRISTYSMMGQYPVNASNPLDLSIHKQHGGDYPNYPYQADTPTGNNTESLVKGEKPPAKINPNPPGYPRAIVEPKEIIVKPGDTVLLRCNATGEEPLKFFWKSGSNDYIPPHVRVSHGALIFRHIRREDVGTYYCVAYNHLGQSSARATIFMDNVTLPQYNSSEPLTIEILHPEITARPGENVNFQCKSNVTGVKYLWTRIGEKMPNSSEIRSDGLLTLYRVSEPNTGTYLCTVSSPSGDQKTAQAVLKLKTEREMLVSPRITIKPKSPLRVRTGSKVRIECESLGFPLPNVTWVRSIDGTDKKLVSTAINKATYEIKQMNKSDVGKYTCNAVNVAGMKSESMSIVIDDGLPCKESEFRCKSGDQCIPREARCDSVKNCRDGTDEAHCKGSRLI